MSEQQALGAFERRAAPSVDGESGVPAGAWATDIERPDSDPLLVVETTDVRADAAVIDETPPADDDITVATYNSANGYAPSEPVTRGVYLDAVIEAFGEPGADWEVDDIVAAAADGFEADLTVYSFPRSRLERRESPIEG